MKPTTNEAIPYPQGHGTNWFESTQHDLVFPDFRNTEWFIVSQNRSNSQQIKGYIYEVLSVRLKCLPKILVQNLIN